MKAKHTLYIIGGPARVGKSTVFRKVMRRRHLITIQTDAIRAAIRKVLIGESHVSIRKLRVTAQATYQRPGSLKQYTIKRTQRPKGEDELAWVGVRGLVETYDRKNIADVLMEGVAATPEWVHALKLKNLRVRAVFIGYGDPSHGKSILAYSMRKRDWVHTWIEEHGGDRNKVNEMVRHGIAQSRKLKKRAKKFGYGYFDVTARPFRKHVAAVASYLLKS